MNFFDNSIVVFCSDIKDNNLVIKNERDVDGGDDLLK